MLTLEPNIAVGRIAADGALSITLSGAWTLRSGFPSAGPIAREIATSRPRSLVFDVRDLGAWDSALVTFLRHLDALCASHQVAMRRDALPVGVQRLLALAEAVPEKPGVRRTSVHTPWIARLGTTALDLGAGSVSAVAFVGEVASATWRLTRRSARQDEGDTGDRCAHDARHPVRRVPRPAADRRALSHDAGSLRLCRRPRYRWGGRRRRRDARSHGRPVRSRDGRRDHPHQLCDRHREERRFRRAD